MSDIQSTDPPQTPRAAAEGQYFRAVRPWYRRPGFRLAVGLAVIVVGVAWLARDDLRSIFGLAGATDTGGSDLETAPGDSPRPIAGGGEDLTLKKWRADGLSVIEVGLPAASLVDLHWIGDRGKRFVAVEKSGVVHRVSSGLRAEARLELGSKVSSVAMSRAGLLVLLPDSQELIIVDPASLEVKGSVSVPKIDHVTSSPELDLAFGTEGRSVYRHEDLTVIDLSNRQVVRQFSASDIHAAAPQTLVRSRRRRALAGFAKATVTPDGRYFFCHSSGALHRFRIVGHGLSYEEVGGWVTEYGRLEVSPDSLYITGRIGRDPSFKPHLRVGYYVYRVTDLSTPMAAIIPGGLRYSPQAVGFDQDSRWVFSSAAGKQLVVFTVDGEWRKEYTLTERKDKVQRIRTHPRGRGVLLLTEKSLLWVKSPFGSWG